MAGHSLGELSALAAADAFSFEDGLRLVDARGRFMQEAGEIKSRARWRQFWRSISPRLKGSARKSAAESGQIVVLANDNCPGQAVVSGELAAVDAS